MPEQYGLFGRDVLLAVLVFVCRGFGLGVEFDEPGEIPGVPEVPDGEGEERCDH
jgi:hypothetical protein